MPRLRKEDAHHIDYRHVIGWLVRKPGAFARYRYREDLYPSVRFRRAYDALVRTHGERADIEYLRILHLAATVGEAQVAEVLAAVLDQVDGFDNIAVQARVAPPVLTVPVIHMPTPDLTVYDGRLVTHARYYWLLLPESHLTRRLFGAMFQWIWAWPVPTG